MDQRPSIAPRPVIWVVLAAVAFLLIYLGAEARPRIRPVEVSLAPTEVERGPRGTRSLALTFDAGGEATAFSTLIENLREEHLQSTFFVTGNWIQQHPDLVRILIKDGHELGNHTFHHQDLTQLSDARIQTELDSTAQMLRQLTARVTPWWRAPYGARNARVLGAAHRLGLTSIYWSLDSLDSVAPPKNSSFLIERICNRTDAELDGAIVLMHVGEPATAAALPSVVSNLRSRHYRLVMVSQLLGDRRTTSAFSFVDPQILESRAQEKQSIRQAP